MPQTLPIPVGQPDAKVPHGIIMFAVLNGPISIEEATRFGTQCYLMGSHDPQDVLAALAELRLGRTPVGKGTVREVFFHMKDHEELGSTVHDLTYREKDVLRALAAGLSYKMIADGLCISFETVRSHIKRIYDKLQVHNSAEAVAKALNGRLLS